MVLTIFCKQLKPVLEFLTQLFIFTNTINRDYVFSVDPLEVLRYLLLLNQDELPLAKSDEVPFVKSELTKKVPFLTSF